MPSSSLADCFNDEVRQVIACESLLESICSYVRVLYVHVCGYQVSSPYPVVPLAVRVDSRNPSELRESVRVSCLWYTFEVDVSPLFWVWVERVLVEV